MDDAVRALVEAGDIDDATTRVLKAYGPEIHGYLLTMHRDEADACDVFAAFSERVWRGLARFGWQCPVRAWAYVIARNESRRAADGRRRRDRREAPLPSNLSALVAEVRTGTLSLYRSENKSALAELRDSLPEDDRTLLILRVDRGLEWRDLARVFHEEGEGELGDEQLRREAARLRKRYQLVKEKLHTLGKQRGLLPGG